MLNKQAFKKALFLILKCLYKLKNLEISIYFPTNAFRSIMSRTTITQKCGGFQTKQATELKCHKQIKILPPLRPDEDKNFGGSLVLDFKK